MFNPRQETLDLVEKVVTETCGVQKQASYETIAVLIDEYVNKHLQQLQEEHREGVKEIARFIKQL